MGRTENISIAVVDDDDDVRSSLDSLLRSAGMCSIGFESARAFLDRDGSVPLACVVTDLHMPGMNGLELQAELARIGSHLPIIMMTAYPTEDVRRAALDAGAAAFVHKPIDPDALLKAIHEATGT